MSTQMPKQHGKYAALFPTSTPDLLVKEHLRPSYVPQTVMLTLFSLDSAVLGIFRSQISSPLPPPPLLDATACSWRYWTISSHELLVPKTELPHVTVHEEASVLGRKCSKYGYFRSLGAVAGFLLLPSLPFGHQLTKIFLLSWCMFLSQLVSTTGEEIWLEKQCFKKLQWQNFP